MAYVSTEETRNIRKTLKANFPNFKFSVTNFHSLATNISILSGPIDFGLGEKLSYTTLNHLKPEKYQDGETLVKMLQVIGTDNIQLNLGKWKKPFVIVK